MHAIHNFRLYLRQMAKSQLLATRSERLPPPQTGTEASTRIIQTVLFILNAKSYSPV